MSTEELPPASPEVRAAAIAEARRAIAATRPPVPRYEPPRERLAPRELTQAEQLQGVLVALRDVRRALAGLEAALADYLPTTEPKEGTTHDD